MYKIYINETPLFLIHSDQLNTIHLDPEKNLLFRYKGKPRTLFQPIDLMEKSQRLDAVYIVSDNYEKLVKDVQGLYKIIEAAGGVVFNPKGEILTMFRRGVWDLPKGKIDKGETKDAAAVREVQEETGLNEVHLGKLLYETWHTYKDRDDKRILKRTYWYKMNTSESNVVPQTEEDIEELCWILPKDFLENKKPIYNTIRIVVEAAIENG